MPNEDTATPETKLTAMCERTIQQLDELSEKLDAYCRELESRAEARDPDRHDRALTLATGGPILTGLVELAPYHDAVVMECP